ncbi:polyprenol phosphomannose-dependent alpha 1,6 mannosyltransferase MptB [Actinomadura xylanilytica]|uniref:polyprenol phosphomannose-dependent alpha 1,6 mannosyltransferase MptB n=1 Tax=Actinomadura xylanilytica TaxID=887459 RepID=UPI00255A8F85|nr:polyprenol phosphomannose-dependent alpha 1,6 mannosyltransferase MptB [Actinomadura xylanilytica]MDL4773585.1 polyprenol phosphomannose-dependent alpha 1,6 mannosyltransferase MptB [Actinomadura xylanilytica]
MEAGADVTGGTGPVAGARQGTAGLIAIGSGLACFLLTAFLGPSVFEPALSGDRAHPPYSLTVHPSPFLVVALVVAGVIAGTAGLGLCLDAVRRGWRCRPVPLVAAGLLVAALFAFMPPIGSSDHLNYAAYGRMVVTGHDPYATRAVDVPGDPVIGAPEEWRRTPSVYGPITTGGQALASWLGDGSVRLTVFVLSILNTLAFALTALILYRTSRTGERRLRTALLWTCNPLVLLHLVAGAHNDVLAIAPMVAAVALFAARPRASGWRALATGAVVGAATAVKLPAALVGGGPAWALLRRARTDRGALLRLAGLFGGAAAVAAIAFALGGPNSLDQVNQSSNMVSLATPWRLVDRALGVGGQRDLIKLCSVALAVVLTVLLARALPREPGAAASGRGALTGGPAGEDEAGESRRIAAALVLAWLFAAPYELPWYDGFAWAMLALLPWSRIDWPLLAHTGVLSLAYLPARAPHRIGMPDSLSWLFTVVRPWVIPLALTAVLGALIAICLRRRDRVPATGRSPRASAGSPG